MPEQQNTLLLAVAIALGALGATLMLDMKRNLEFLANREKDREKDREKEKEARKKKLLKSDGGYFVVSGCLWQTSTVEKFSNEGIEAAPASESLDAETDSQDIDMKSSPENKYRDSYELIKKRIEEMRAIDHSFLKICNMPSEIEIANVTASLLNGNKNFGSNISTENWIAPNPLRAAEKNTRRIYRDSDRKQQEHNIFFTKASTQANDSTKYRTFAHAVPVDLACSIFWLQYLPILTGETGSPKQLFHALHGLVDIAGDLLDSQGNNSNNDPNTYAYQGVKNIPQNVLAFPPNHDDVFDGKNAGKMIGTPIVDLNKEVTTNRDKFAMNSYFDFLVVGSAPEVYRWIYNGAKNSGFNLSSIFLPELDLDVGVEEATQEEILIATDFMKHYVMAAAYLGREETARMIDPVPTETSGGSEMNSTEHSGKDSPTLAKKMCEKVELLKMKFGAKAGDQYSMRSSSSKANNLSALNTSAPKVKAIRSALDQVESEGGVRIPVVHSDFDYGEQKVLKVRLKTWFEKSGVALKYYPSATSFGMKAAANWLKLVGTPFIPSCGNDESAPISFLEIHQSLTDSLCGSSLSEISLSGSLDDDLSEPLSSSDVSMTTSGPGINSSGIAVVTP